MAYNFEKGMMYMMPTHFGPMTGPRQGPDGQQFECRDNPKSTSYSVSFLTNSEQIEELLPRGFSLNGDPVVTINQTHMKEIEWLAGRGYNVMGVTFPVIYSGTKDRAIGPFLSVLWENLADPILTGREQLGFAKIYCELPEPVVCQGETFLSGSWLGFRFIDIRLRNMEIVTTENNPAPPAPGKNDILTGQLHLKYLPSTDNSSRDGVDAVYATLTPSRDTNQKVLQMWRGDGTVNFHAARWQDMPTQFRIVNALKNLEIKEYLGATITQTIGGRDLSDQRKLE